MRLYQLLLIVLVWQERTGTSTSTLQKLLILFRHGFRAPDGVAYGKLEDCFPAAKPGNLTALGRSQMSYLGYFLRMRYNSFIGSDPDQTLMIYSDYPRNVESAKLVFDGLFSQYNHSTVRFTKIDPVVDGPLETSDPYYYESFDKMVNRADYEDLMRRITETNQTKYPIEKLHQLNSVEDQIICQLANDCPLPKWIDSSIQSRLDEFNNAYYSAYRKCEFEQVIRDNSDSMVQEIIKAFDLQNSKNTHKAYLYSSHDTNIAALLSRLGMFNGLPPPFGAFVVFELHSAGQQGDSPLVRVLYFNSTDYTSPPQRFPDPSGKLDSNGMAFPDFASLATGPFPCRPSE